MLLKLFDNVCERLSRSERGDAGQSLVVGKDAVCHDLIQGERCRGVCFKEGFIRVRVCSEEVGRKC